MPLDGLALAALAWELNRTLAGARVVRVLQPLDDQVVFQLRRNRDSVNLVVGAHPLWPGVYTSPGPFEHRLQPPPFCMLLRKYLEGGRLLAVSQPGWERVLHLIFETAQSVDGLQRVTLVAELIPRRTNLTLVEGLVPTPEETPAGPDRGDPHGPVILDALHRRPGRAHERLPGQPYQGPPPLEKIDPLAEASKVATVLRLVPSQRPLAQHMSNHWHGLSPQASSWLLAQAGVDPHWSGPLEEQGAVQRVVECLQATASACRQGRVQPGVVQAGRRSAVVDAWVFPLPATPPDVWIPCRNVDEALGRWLTSRLQEEETEQLRSELEKFLRTQLEKLQRKLQHRQKDLERANKADWYRRCADLLMAHLHQINPRAVRQGQVTVTDWFAQEGASPPQMVIPVDPSLTVSGNAQRYYHLYSKYKEARHLIEAQLEETRHEMAYLQQVALSVQWSEDRASLVEIVDELQQAGYTLRLRSQGRQEKPAPGTRGSGARKAAAKAEPTGGNRPYRLVLEDGSEIRIGRNNRQNDQLTLRWAQPDDWWFHARQIPGAHVLLRLPPGSSSPEEHPEAFHCALLLAGWFSRGREASKVAVDYTQRKNVRKPKGARPGMVIYDHQRTVMVPLDGRALEPLLARLQENSQL